MLNSVVAVYADTGSAPSDDEFDEDENDDWKTAVLFMDFTSWQKCQREDTQSVEWFATSPISQKLP